MFNTEVYCPKEVTFYFRHNDNLGKHEGRTGITAIRLHGYSVKICLLYGEGFLNN